MKIGINTIGCTVLMSAMLANTMSVFADTYTWTGAASATWNKTDANWDKGAWVDGNIAKFPDGVSVKDITLGADVSVGGIAIETGSWSLGGAHTLMISVTGNANALISQTSSASLTLKNGITVSAASPCENNLNELNIENATFEIPAGRFHNGWNGGSGLAGGATINVRDGGVLTVYEFVPSPSQSAANAGIYRVNVTTGGVFRLNHTLTQYNIDTSRYGTLYFDGGTLEGYGGSSTMFSRPSATKIKLGPGGMRIAGDNPVYLRTGIEPFDGSNGGISVETSRLVYFYYGNDGLPESTFTGPICLNGGGIAIFNGDRNFGEVPASPKDGIVFGTSSTLLSHGHITINPNRNILINSNAVATIASEGYSIAVAGTISGDAPGGVRNGTLSTESAWAGELSLIPPAGRTNSIGRLLVKKQDLTIGGEGVTEITDTLNNLSSTGDNGVFAVMDGATLNVTNGLVRVMTNNYTIVENGNLNVSGGVLDLSRQQLFVNAHNGPATTTVSRAGTLIANNYCLSLYQGEPESGLTRLQSGGTLVFNELYMHSVAGKLIARAQIDFDGGVLAPQTATRWFLGKSEEWYTNILCVVKEGGAVISNNVEIWTRRPFVSGAEQDGGLHKWGTGKLAIITTGNTFNGPIEVHQGTLIWGNNNNYFPTARLITHDGGIADINTCGQELARVEGDGEVMNCRGLVVTDAVAPGFDAAAGTLKFAERCTFDDCLLEIDANDRLMVCDGQDISGLSLHVNDVSALDQTIAYEILGMASGDFTGTFKGDNIQGCSNWRIKYDHANHRILLKYMRGTVFVGR